MGALCDWAVGALESLWTAFFPPEEEIPDCVREWLEELFPNVDFDRVTVHSGQPPVIAADGPPAIALPGWGSPSEVHIYFRDGLPDPCDCGEGGLASYAHEFVHAQQYQNYLGGYGLGLFRLFLYVYILCWVRHGYEDNPLEREAENFDNQVENCCTAARQPCDCSGDEPVLDDTGLQNWRNNCGNLVFRETDVGFFEHLWSCTPGVERLWDAVESVWEECGEFRERRVGDDPTADDGGVLDNPVTNWIAIVAACIGTTIVAGVLALVTIAYFLAFLTLYTAVFNLLMTLWTALKVIYLAISAVWAVITGILCALDYIWQGLTWLFDQIRQAIQWLARQVRRGLVAACNWAQQMERRCVQWASHRRRQCRQYRTRKRRECRRTATRERRKCRNYRTNKRKECKRKGKKRRKKCCDWVPCSWGCKAVHWVVETVCVAYHWVTEKVCEAWETVKETVCVAYHWVTEKVCEAYTTVVEKTCEATAWVVTGTTCWARGP